MPEQLGRILEREGRSVHLPENAFDGLLRRRDRKRRNQRIGASIAALAIAVALIAGAATAVLDRSAIEPGSEPISAQNVASLHEVWTARVGNAPTPAITDGVVATANSDGRVQAFSAACRAPCSPLWTADVGEMPVSADDYDRWIKWWPGAADQPNAGYRAGSVTGADGVFYLLGADGVLHAFDAHCRDDRGMCTPAWTAVTDDKGSDMSLPMVSDGLIYVVGRAGTSAFRVGCAEDGDACRPVWQRPIVGALRVQDGHLYTTEVSTGTPMELDPETGNTIWSGGANPCCGNTPTPVLLGGRIYVNFGHLLAAYPTTCRGTCDPVWSIHVPDRFSDGPQLAGDTLVLSTAQNAQNGGLWFIPLSCAEPGSDCAEGVRARTVGEITTYQPVTSGTQVFATSPRGSGFWIFDAAGCVASEACHPVGYDLSLDTLAPYAPVVSGDVVFVADSTGALHAFDTSCTGACQPAWSSPVMLPYQPPLIDGARVFSTDERGMLHAFETGGPLPPPASVARPSTPGSAPWFYLALAVATGGVYVIRRRRALR